jgi:ring-1,2-phenylacetyl-CoA epoxidase subunit PaaA
VAGDIGVDVSYVLSWPNEKRYLEAFRGLINTWEDYAVFGFLIDRVGLYQLEEFSDCTDVALPKILPEIIKEELGHIGFGTNKTAELAAKGDEQKEKVQSAVNFWYIKALDMFGHSESKRSERFVYWGIKRRTNAQAREEYIQEVTPLIANMGLNTRSCEGAEVSVGLAGKNVGRTSAERRSSERVLKKKSPISWTKAQSR